MANPPSLFGGKGLAIPEHLRDKFKATTDRLAGGVGEYRRISIKGNRFRKIVNGEQHVVTKEPQLNVVVIEAAPVSRLYHEKKWDPENPSAPTCWSPDGELPSPEVENPQSKRCATCPMNVKGSGNNDSRACRFAQRLAVSLEGDLSTVYQMQLPAASIFGKPENGNMPMQAYARVLKEYDTPINAVVTEVSFDEDSESPKLFFKPVRPLEVEEFEEVAEIMDSEEVKNALEFTVTQSDTAPQGEDKPKRTRAALPQPVEDDEDEDEDEDEPPPPKKKRRKPEPEPEPEMDDEDEDDEEDGETDKLTALIGAWDDD